MSELSREKVLFSPQSKEDSQYEITSGDEVDRFATTLLPYLRGEEHLIPLIGRETIKRSIWWAAWEIANNYLKPAWQNEQSVVFTYNLEGARHFQQKLQQSLQLACNVLELPHDLLRFVPIRVSTSTGYMQFSEEPRVEWPLEIEDLTDYVVVSIDDIGDTGRTQNEIRKQCLQRGAAQVVTVNLFEKKLEPDQKMGYPDISLLEIENRYVIGSGLDAGTDDIDRENAFRAIPMLFVLALATM